jgi:hypothetical protein
MEISLNACEMRRVRGQVNSDGRSIRLFGIIILQRVVDVANGYELFILDRDGSYRYSGFDTDPVRYAHGANFTRFPAVHHRAADFERMTR